MVEVTEDAMKTAVENGNDLGVAPRPHDLGKLQIGMLDDASPSRTSDVWLETKAIVD